MVRKENTDRKRPSREDSERPRGREWDLKQREESWNRCSRKNRAG